MTSPEAQATATAEALRKLAQATTQDFTAGVIGQFGKLTAQLGNVQRQLVRTTVETTRLGTANRSIGATLQVLTTNATRAVQPFSRLSQVLQSIVATARTVFTTIVRLWTQTLTTVNRINAVTWPQIQRLILQVLSTVNQAMNVTWPQIQRTIAQVLAVITQLMNVTWPQISRLVTQTVGSILGTINKLVTQTLPGIQRFISGTIGGIQKFITETIEGVKLFITRLLPVAVAMADQLVDRIIGKIRQLIRDAPTLLALGLLDLGRSIVDGIWRGFQSVWHRIVDVGTSIVSGIWQGIQNAWHLIVDGLRSLGKQIVDGFSALFGIRSPSTVMAELGGHLGEGLAVGITDSRASVAKAMAELVAVPDPIALKAGGVMVARSYATAQPAAPRGATSSPVTVHVHPRAEQSEYEIGRIAAREVAWAAKH